MSSFRCFGIVPACGKSRRMGRPKLLLPWRGSTVIEHVLTAWINSRVDRTVVVVRADDTALIAKCKQLDVDVVFPQAPPEDMKASVQVGLRHIIHQFAPKTHDAWLLAPADSPLLDASLIDQIVEQHGSTNPTIVVPVNDGKRGHPVLFPWQFHAEVLELGKGQGVNAIIARHGAQEIECQDRDVASDLDTPDDYQRLLQP